jgi:hypothetical protein
MPASMRQESNRLIARQSTPTTNDIRFLALAEARAFGTYASAVSGNHLREKNAKIKKDSGGHAGL